METIECKNCGSSALELVGNEYVCQACGSRFQASELFSTPQSESTVQLTEEKKSELKRLKANLKDDHSLSKRILELDPYDWEAYCYTYSLSPSDQFDKWLICLQRSGLSVKEIENILNVYYYEKQKQSAIEWHLEDLKRAINSDYLQDSYFKNALTRLLKFKEDIHSKGIHIKSILGEEYSSLIQKWEADWADTSTRYTKELQNKRNAIEEKKKEEEETRKEKKRKEEETSKKYFKYGMIVVMIGVILFIAGLVQFLSTISAGWLLVGILGGAALICTGILLSAK